MWSPDMPPCSWQRGEREGGTVWLPWKCGTCVSHAQASAHSSRPSSIPFSRCPPLSLLLHLPSSALCCSCLPHTAQRNDTKNRWKIVTKMYYGLSLWHLVMLSPQRALSLLLPLRSSARSLCLLLGNWTCDERARASAGHNHSEGCTNSLQGLNELWIERDKPGESSEGIALLLNI